MPWIQTLYNNPKFIQHFFFCAQSEIQQIGCIFTFWEEFHIIPFSLSLIYSLKIFARINNIMQSVNISKLLCKGKNISLTSSPFNFLTFTALTYIPPRELPRKFAQNSVRNSMALAENEIYNRMHLHASEHRKRDNLPKKKLGETHGRRERKKNPSAERFWL